MLDNRISLLNFIRHAHLYGYVKNLAESEPDLEWLVTICELTRDFYRELDDEGRSHVDAIRQSSYAGRDTRSVAAVLQPAFDGCLR